MLLENHNDIRVFLSVALSPTVVVVLNLVNDPFRRKPRGTERTAANLAPPFRSGHPGPNGTDESAVSVTLVFILDNRASSDVIPNEPRVRSVANHYRFLFSDSRLDIQPIWPLTTNDSLRMTRPVKD
ncbi:hypothetical protein SEA_KARP_263 [Streptomyces phage Karp]|nr:hypothetical protein SEA_KARP_263 [Streptomyces phage Karp]